MPTNLLQRRRRNLLAERRSASQPQGIQGVGDIVENVGQGLNRYLGSVVSGADYALGGFMDDTPEGQKSRYLGRAAQILKGEEDVPGLEGTRFAREPETPGEEIFQAGGRVVGESMAPGGALLRQGAKIAKPVGTAVQQFAQRFAQGASQTAVARPATVAAGEIAAATGAGSGGEVGKQNMPNYPLTGEALGSMLGAPLATLAGPRMAGRAALKAGRFARDIVSPSARQARTEEIIGQHLGPQLRSDPMRGNLERSQAVTERVQGFEPDLAQRTQSEALKETKNSIYRKASGGDLEDLKARDARNREALAEFQRTAGPSKRATQGAQGAVQPLLESRLAEQQELTNLGNQRANLARPDQTRALEKQYLSQLEERTTGRRAAVVDSLTRINRPQVGSEIRSTFQAERSKRAAAFDKDMERLGLKSMKFEAPMAEFEHQVRAARNALSPAERKAVDKMGSKVTLDSFKKRKSINFDDIKKYRQDLATDIQEAMRDTAPGHRVRQAHAMQMRDLLDEHVINSDMLAPHEAARMEDWRMMRQRYVDDIIKPFETGAVFDVRRSDGTGFLRTADEDVGITMLRDARSAEQIAEIGRANPRLLRTMEEVALDDIAGSVVANGTLSERGIERWAEKHRTAMEALPNLKSVVDDLIGRVKVVEQGRRRGIQEIRGNTDRISNQVRLEQQQLDAAMQPIKDRLAGHVVRMDGLEDSDLARRLAITRGSMTRKLSRVEAGTLAQGSFIQQVMEDPQMIKMVVDDLAMMGDQGKSALRSLRRHVWDQLGELNGESLGSYMQSHQRQIRTAFRGSPKHIENLEVLRDGLRMMEFSPAAGSASPIEPDLNTQIKQMTGMDPQQVASRYVNVRSGRLSSQVAGIDSLFRWITARNKDAMQQVMRRALFDPAVAQSLIDSATANPQGIPDQKLRAWLWNLGLIAPTEAASRNIRGDNGDSN